MSRPRQIARVRGAPLEGALSMPEAVSVMPEAVEDLTEAPAAAEWRLGVAGQCTGPPFPRVPGSLRRKQAPLPASDSDTHISPP